jgi:hypothetical protein
VSCESTRLAAVVLWIGVLQRIWRVERGPRTAPPRDRDRAV